MLTRDTEQIRLNEIHVLCMEAVDHYRAAASDPCIADMEPVFSQAANAYQKFAGQLAAYIRAHDDQPRLPDPDKETLGLLFTALKTKLASNERQILIEDQARIEQKVGEAVQSALQTGLPAEIQAVLQRILAHSSSMRQDLHDRL